MIVMHEGLSWCSGCGRAVLRGWPHTPDCQVGHWGEAAWTARDVLVREQVESGVLGLELLAA